MDHSHLEQLGDELRQIGHQRRVLVEQIFEEVKEGDSQSSKQLYSQLSAISDQAIEIISRQKNMIDEQLRRM